MTGGGTARHGARRLGRVIARLVGRWAPAAALAIALVAGVGGVARAQEPVAPPAADTVPAAVVDSADSAATSVPLPPVPLLGVTPGQLRPARHVDPMPVPPLVQPVLPVVEPVEFPEPSEEHSSTWKRTLELAGSLFVGNKPQTVLTTRVKSSHADSSFEMGADVRFTYGETSQEGAREVSQRHWLGSVNLDLWPFAAQSPFLLGTIESSLERRIELRLSGGVGHKLTFVDNKRSLASFSVAILAERSRFPVAAAGVSEQHLARFSARLRLRRGLGERTSVSHETFFQPEYANLDRYTLTNNLSATYRLNDVVNLKLNYLDNYDTEARGRGARSNYDGQLVVGVQADF